MRRVMPVILLLALSACQPSGSDGSLPGERSDTQPFAQIAMDETLHFSGTEPFWGGDVTGERLTYKTPEDLEGQTVTVSRFAGRGGLSYSGTLAPDTGFTMAITAGKCSDGMSDRLYPYVVTLQLGDMMRTGCAWSDKHPFEGPQAP